MVARDDFPRESKDLSPIAFKSAWIELYSFYGEMLDQTNIDIMDSVLQGVVVNMDEASHQLYNDIIKLRSENPPVSYRKIGRILGISRERVRQIEKGKPKSIKPNTAPKVMLTPKEAGRLIGVHVNTLRRWSDQGILRSYRIGIRGDRRFRREDIVGILKLRETLKNFPHLGMED